MRSTAFAMLGIVAACSLAGATPGVQAELMPTVKLREVAAVSELSECAMGADAPVARVPEPEPARPMEMPHAVELTGEAATSAGAVLRQIQDAAEEGDREAFHSALADGQHVASLLGPGAQKDAVHELLALYGDLARVWDYSFAAPIGAFFDQQTQGGSLLTALITHPGYMEAISSQTVSDGNGGRYYPTRETREFLLSVASSKLHVMGGVPPSAFSRSR